MSPRSYVNRAACTPRAVRRRASGFRLQTSGFRAFLPEVWGLKPEALPQQTSGSDPESFPEAGGPRSQAASRAGGHSLPGSGSEAQLAWL